MVLLLNFRYGSIGYSSTSIVIVEYMAELTR
jgi:hypothetical protein